MDTPTHPPDLARVAAMQNAEIGRAGGGQHPVCGHSECRVAAMQNAEIGEYVRVSEKDRACQVIMTCMLQPDTVRAFERGFCH